jgi:hypothetical protein
MNVNRADGDLMGIYSRLIFPRLKNCRSLIRDRGFHIDYLGRSHMSRWQARIFCYCAARKERQTFLLVESGDGSIRLHLS